MTKYREREIISRFHKFVPNANLLHYDDTQVIGYEMSNVGNFFHAEVIGTEDNIRTIKSRDPIWYE